MGIKLRHTVPTDTRVEMMVRRLDFQGHTLPALLPPDPHQPGHIITDQHLTITASTATRS